MLKNLASREFDHAVHEIFCRKFWMDFQRRSLNNQINIIETYAEDNFLMSKANGDSGRIGSKPTYQQNSENYSQLSAFRSQNNIIEPKQKFESKSLSRKARFVC